MVRRTRLGRRAEKVAQAWRRFWKDDVGIWRAAPRRWRAVEKLGFFVFQVDGNRSAEWTLTAALGGVPEDRFKFIQRSNSLGAPLPNNPIIGFPGGRWRQSQILFVALLVLGESPMIGRARWEGGLSVPRAL